AARGGGEDVVHGTREPRPVLLGEAEPVEGDGGGDGGGEVADEVGRAQLDERVHGPCGVPGDHRPEPVDGLRGEQRVDQVAVAGGAGRVQLDRVLLQAGPAGDDDRDAVRAGRLAGGGEGVVVTGDARHVGVPRRVDEAAVRGRAPDGTALPVRGVVRDRVGVAFV